MIASTSLTNSTGFSVLALVFGAATPTWTDKEVVVTFVTALGAISSVALFVWRFMTNRLRKKIKSLTIANQQLTQVNGSLSQQANQSQQELAAVVTKLQSASVLLGPALNPSGVPTPPQTPAHQLQAILDALHDSVGTQEGQLTAVQRRIQRVVEKDGQIWTEKVRANTPEFKPFDPVERRTPILSILNLKGGVGKTTLTANLGAALHGLGFRVLLLDLDLQGSLSALFLSQPQQNQLFAQDMMLEGFLARAFDAEFPNLLDYVQPILNSQQSSIVPTSDVLAYAEANLMIRWLLREGNKDPRFLLRKELHLKRITGNYDIVLLDCPPLINICCANALAASDYLLIPILPSKQATARVPVLLERVKEFRQSINPALKVLGVVPNRTQRSELTADEENRLSLLRKQGLDILGQPVRVFDTFIRQSKEVRTAEDENRPLGEDDQMYESFRELAREVITEMPHFVQATAKSTTAPSPSSAGT